MFSIDFDEACLTFDPTDANPADGLPDAIAFSVPAGFTTTATVDLGDTDGEIDVTIADLAPPISTLPDGTLLTATFGSTCVPALSTSIEAPVVFSTTPSASFGDDQGQNLVGGSQDGSVEVHPGPRGDCNSSGDVQAADLVADALEIFDADGNFWADVTGDTFVGSPVGCDANSDTVVDAGDVSCTVLLIFGGTCGGTLDVNGGKAARASRLWINGDRRLPVGRTVWLPVQLRSGGRSLTSLAFSLNYDPRYLEFAAQSHGPADLSDGVQFPAGRPMLANIRLDASGRAGKLNVLLSEDFGRVFDDGVVVRLPFRVLRSGRVADALRFDTSPRPSFGDRSGASVAGEAAVWSRGQER